MDATIVDVAGGTEGRVFVVVPSALRRVVLDVDDEVDH